jgi:hypothetical protein
MEVMKYSVHYNSWLLKLFPKKTIGITLCSHIFLRKSRSETPQWVINHELIHVAQFKKHGFWGFLYIYRWKERHLKYRQKSFEIEAYGHDNEVDTIQYLITKYKYIPIRRA